MGKSVLTASQKRVYDYLKSYVREKGYPPAIREIGAYLNLKSTSTVHTHLIALEGHGLIKRAAGKNRTIEILEPEFHRDSRSVSLPLVGQVTAGLPILAVENIEEYVSVPMDIVKDPDESFLLRISGNSMIDRGIHNNDLVVVNRQSTANNGDIVVAMIDEYATVKTFYKEEDHVRLQPANDDYQPILSRDVVIVGKVVGLVRSYI